MAPTNPVHIDASPVAGQLVEHNGSIYTTIKEGRAFILVPPDAKTSVDPQATAKADDSSRAQTVFYNPIQQFNRDLSVLAIKAFGEDLCDRKRRRHELQADKVKSKNQNRKRQEAETDSRSPNGVSAGQKRKRGEDSPSRKETNVVAASTASAIAIEPGPNSEQVEVNGTSEDSAGHSESVPIDETSHMSAANGDRQTNPGWEPRFRILDALSATGLRALRYASEIPFATGVVANDMDRNAVKSIGTNVKHNKLDRAITTHTGNAIAHMYRVAYPPEDSHGPLHQSGKYDVIDLDPYGTAAPFIDSALQALADGGMLCVTCTDSGVWASCGYSEKAFSLYGGIPIKGQHSHEGGLRLILHSIATAAARYSLAIEPLLSLSIDFYARVFVRVKKSPAEVKFLAGKTMLVYGCDAGCGSWSTQFIGRHSPHKNNNGSWKYSISQAPSEDRLCSHCGSKMHIAGPMWGGPLHNPAFIEKILRDLESNDDETYNTKRRIEGMLDTALDELSVNRNFLFKTSTTASERLSSDIIPAMPPELIDSHPFYFIPSVLCKVLKAQAPRDEQLRGALRHAGYNVAKSHCKGGSIKTNASFEVIWEIMREWVRQKSPIKEGALKEGQPGFNILQSMRSAPAPSASESPSVRDQIGASDTGVETPEITTEKIAETKEVEPGNIRNMTVVFDEKLGRDKPGKRLMRYQQNPRENWGPMSRAKGSG